MLLLFVERTLIIQYKIIMLHVLLSLTSAEQTDLATLSNYKIVIICVCILYLHYLI